MRKVVINSTPIIALYEIGQLGLLKELYHSVIIPEAVYQEVTQKDDELKQWISQNREWFVCQKIQFENEKKMYHAKLHKGEVEVMILAQEMNADLVILDDLLARKTAEYLGLNITGTVGVLIKAKRKGILSEVMPLVDNMLGHGIYLSDKLIQSIRKIANE